MKIKNPKCIIIFGLSGSGKSTISELIFKNLEREIGKSILIHGDTLRVLFKNLGFNFGYTKRERNRSIIPTQNVIQFLLSSGLNVLFNNVCLNKKAYNTWKKNINNLVYVYIKTDVDKIIKFGKKNKLYKKNKNVVGLDIKPDIPKKPHIIIENNFDRSIEEISIELMKKMKKFF